MSATTNRLREPRLSAGGTVEWRGEFVASWAVNARDDKHAALSRQLVRHIVSRWNLAVDLVDDITTVVSEAVTNCILHARTLSPLASVTLWRDSGGVLVSVHDRHPRVPSLVIPFGSYGRGLMVMRGLAEERGGWHRAVRDFDNLGKSMQWYLSD